MSSIVSWPTSRAFSRPDSDEEIEPKFERPEYFHRSPGKGGWYCSACARFSEPLLDSFSATAATSHEQSQSHKDNIARFASWEPMAVDNWGVFLKPYGQLQDSQLSREVPLKKKVLRWIRDIAKAEGIEVQVEEGLDDDEPENADWDQWGAGGDDWKRPQEEWGFPVGAVPPPADMEIDPQASADFKFVEKVARKRGSTKDRRRLHAFYRLPTEEKVSRIQEIVQFIHAH